MLGQSALGWANLLSKTDSKDQVVSDDYPPVMKHGHGMRGEIPDTVYDRYNYWFLVGCHLKDNDNFLYADDIATGYGVINPSTTKILHAK